MSTAIIREVVAGLISLFIVLLFILVILYQVVNGKPIEVPPFLLGFGAIIVGAYVGQHAAVNGAAQGAVSVLKGVEAQINGTTKPGQPTP